MEKTITTREELLESLRGHLERLKKTPRRDQRVVRSGYPQLDQILPAGGFERGTLVEWLGIEEACGAGTFALEVAREAARGGGAIVVLDRRRWFYPVAAAGLGIDLRRLIVVLARNHQDEVWAIDQALRCSGVAAVWAPIERIDWRSFRRLQLAAESGEAIGLLLRPSRTSHGQPAYGQPTWAHLQLLVEPHLPGQRLVHLLRSKTPAGLDTGPPKQEASASHPPPGRPPSTGHPVSTENPASASVVVAMG